MKKSEMENIIAKYINYLSGADGVAPTSRERQHAKWILREICEHGMLPPVPYGTGYPENQFVPAEEQCFWEEDEDEVKCGAV